MNKKKKIENYQEVAAATGLRYDEGNDVFHGQRDGFDFIVYPVDESHPYMMVLHTAAKSPDGSALEKNKVKEFQKSNKNVAYLGQKNMDIRVSMKSQSNAEKLKGALTESIAATTAFLRANGYHPCCDLCGQEVETGALKMGGEYYHMCPDCETKMRGDIAMKEQQTAQKKENIIGGIVGAFLGSLLGALSVLVLSQLADRVDWAIILFRDGGGSEAGYNVFECYRLVPAAIYSEIIDMGSYIANLLLLYVFVALGAVPTVRGRMKEKKEAGIITRLN